MSVTQAVCASFKQELLSGIHDFGVDELRMALYDRAAALLDGTTTTYTTTGEISGTGYTAAGKVLSVSDGFPSLNAGSAQLRFDNIAWTRATFTAGAALIYNASKANRAICVLDFGVGHSVTNGTFTVQFPTNLSPTIQLL